MQHRHRQSNKARVGANAALKNRAEIKAKSNLRWRERFENRTPSFYLCGDFLFSFSPWNQKCGKGGF